MKILLVGTDKLDSEYGGGQVYIKSLVYGLISHGNEVVHLSLSFKNVTSPKLEKGNTAEVDSFQLLLPINWQKQHWQILRSKITVELASFIKQISPDIIHAHGWKDFAVLAAKRADIPCVVTAHHGGIVCPAGALLNADDVICQVPASDDNCLKCCTKFVPGWHFWFPLINLLPYKFRLWAGERLRCLPFILFITPLGTISCNIRDKMKTILDIGKNADRIIAPSSSIAVALVRNGIPEQKIVIVPHGIPLLQSQPLRPDFGTGPVRFLFVGRISHVKGLHIMLEAFASLPPETYELHIVGGAVTKPELRYLARLKRTFASVNAVWHSSRPHEEVTQHLAQCDVMIHPSICLEVFGLTIAEALAFGRPVIASRCGGTEFQIRNGENGLLVPPNDSAALVDKIGYVLRNPSEIMRLSSNIRPVRTLEDHVHDLFDLYRELT